MPPLERGVGDLQDVEHAHVDLLPEIRQRAGHPEKADLASLLHLLQGLEAAILLQRLAVRAGVKLDHVQVVRLHALEALLHARDHVLPRENVRRSLAGRRLRRAHLASALGGKEVLLTPARDESPDELLAHPVVDGGIDIVDPGIEHGIQDAVGFLG